MRRIVIVDGHPDPSPHGLIHTLAHAYAEEAKPAGHEVQGINLRTLDFSLLRDPEDFWHRQPPEVTAGCQPAIARPDHLVILIPRVAVRRAGARLASSSR
jgi:putative NADPH-quinone reductase